MLTQSELKDALPVHLKSAANQELTDTINNITTDPEFNQNFKENFISYTSVLMEGKFRIPEYINAVTYVSLKLLGFTNQEAYKRTFHGRYQKLVARGADDKEISAYVAAYNKTKLVNLILEQTLVPTWVLNQNIYQQAINVQAEMMLNANSEKVRVEAANSILTHLKRPEKQQVEVAIGVTENSGMKDLKETLAELAHQQQQLIAQGVNTKDIAHQDLVKDPIDGECKDVTPK